MLFLGLFCVVLRRLGLTEKTQRHSIAARHDVDSNPTQMARAFAIFSSLHLAAFPRVLRRFQMIDEFNVVLERLSAVKFAVIFARRFTTFELVRHTLEGVI
jgi:hypothetical protein